MMNEEDNTNQTTTNPSSRIVVGCILWILTIQFLIVQFIVQSSWATPFSLSKNFISDLGAVHSGEFPPDSGNFINSPNHALMNASFMVFGLFIALGAILIGRNNPTKLVRPTVISFIVAGIGVILVGNFPEDTIIAMHGIGALMQVFGCSVGFILAGLIVKQKFKMFSNLSIILGVVSAVAFIITSVISIKHVPFLGLYVGTWERISIWPEPVWFVIIGLILVSRYRYIFKNLDIESKHASNF
ncbi:MAG: DUF998 domain-containing protein [Janthinobacterium lividum]